MSVLLTMTYTDHEEVMFKGTRNSIKGESVYKMVSFCLIFTFIYLFFFILCCIFIRFFFISSSVSFIFKLNISFFLSFCFFSNFFLKKYPHFFLACWIPYLFYFIFQLFLFSVFPLHNCFSLNAYLLRTFFILSIYFLFRPFYFHSNFLNSLIRLSFYLLSFARSSNTNLFANYLLIPIT